MLNIPPSYAGSFGTYPAPVQKALRNFQDEAEAAPDVFLRYTKPKLLDKSRAALANLLDAPTSSLCMIPNATTGINTILRNLVYRPGDKILYFSTIYGACEKTILSITETTPAEAVKIDLTYPISDASLVSTFSSTISRLREEGSRPRIVLFDTISSSPGVRMPFEALTAACRDLHILSLIDGAHGVGHLPLNLTALDPDFFISNAHKWLFVPRGCAVLYVAQRNQSLIRTSYPTSHGFLPAPKPGDRPISSPLPPSEGEGATAFTKLFEYTGTIDCAPYMCVPAALKFREEVCGGEGKIMAYCVGLARRGGDRLAEMLGTEVLENEEGSLTKDSAMVNMRLPLESEGGAAIKVGGSGPMGVVYWISKAMVEEYNTFMAVQYHGDAWWVRLSGQVYLQMEDIEWGAGVLLQLCERVRKGEHLEKVV